MTRVLLHGSLAQAETIDAALIAGVVADEERDLPAPRADAPATPRPAATVANDAAATTLTRADPQTEARIAALEARIAEQDAALRRVLTLLVDWVEGDAARAEAMRGAA